MRGRRADRVWVHNHVLNTPVVGTVHQDDFEQLCLMEAYENGLKGLRTYLGLIPSDQADLEQLRRDRQVALAVKAKTACRTLRADSFNALEILKVASMAEQADGQPDGSAGGSQLSDRSSRDLLEQISGVGLSVSAVTNAESEEKNDPVEKRVCIVFEKELELELQRRREGVGHGAA